uniref:NADH-ubiquinone oxidoreductase chain 6 n=1 Tax=Danionella mirifica TaxID=487619 RepID=F3Y707_9TELE|nr:NADH dehydrogenase subunit 6 [Danionella mirifica]
MSYCLSFLLGFFIMGVICVACNPSPYFGALSMVVVAGAGCGILTWCKGSFLSLVLFLGYLGGMLVVFAYSAALSAEPFPETLGSHFVFRRMLILSCAVILVVWFFLGGWHEGLLATSESFNHLSSLSGDIKGIAIVYGLGVKILILCAWVLFLSLFIVMEVTWGAGYGVLRAV